MSLSQLSISNKCEWSEREEKRLYIYLKFYQVTFTWDDTKREKKQTSITSSAARRLVCAPKQPKGDTGCLISPDVHKRALWQLERTLWSSAPTLQAAKLAFNSFLDAVLSQINLFYVLKTLGSRIISDCVQMTSGITIIIYFLFIGIL